MLLLKLKVPFGELCLRGILDVDVSVQMCLLNDFVVSPVKMCFLKRFVVSPVCFLSFVSTGVLLFVCLVPQIQAESPNPGSCLFR